MHREQFRTRIRRSIADENLQIALDNNAQRRKDGRLAALAQLPDHQERRQKAKAIKAGVVATLELQLEKFIARAEANGLIIHRAADAAEALQIVLQIAAKVQPGGERLLVAKSKSMVSEEINFNHALEAGGIKVVETDLGEYIVQLRGERPSHIITPAVHLRRGDVGRLFAEKLGLAYTEDIPTLTNTARKVLRQVFLNADIGLSGVNFGVVETGTLCMVTNEGNGRMVTTLPRMHVALMGIERLVPSLDDLALFLSLLPRSATGQKLSVYTSLINAPLPGQVRHLVLLDNGRRALRDSSLSESLACIRCGACLNACPVFRELGGHAYGSIYPGPIGSVISAALVGPEYACLSQASSLCGACKEACPVDIDLPGMLLRLRAGQVPGTTHTAEGVGLPAPVKLGLRGFRLAAGRASLFGFFQRLGGLASRIYSPRRGYMRIPAWTGWGFSKDFPRLAPAPFRAQWKNIRQEVRQPAPELPFQPAPEPPFMPFAVPVAPPARTAPEAFCAELSALGGTPHRVSAKELAGKVGELLKERGVKRLMLEPGLEAYAGGIPFTTEPDPTLRCGLTSAVCGIADTGSLLLTSGDDRNLATSLLPEMHIAVLMASRLLPTLGDALHLEEFQRAASAVVVSGPSRTADIEMTLTIGVHGPGELHVFLIDDI
jgi:L-lactate dehydrogenase complex protein LldF